MADSGSRPQLHVEGTNDRHTICHVLIRRGIDYDQEPWPESYPVIKEIGSRDEFIEGVDVAVSLSNHKSIGFVLDANSSVQDRWKAISSRLSKVGIDPPDKIPRKGFIGEAPKYDARVGVWIMPDNQREGTLEKFFLTGPCVPAPQPVSQLRQKAHAGCSSGLECEFVQDAHYVSSVLQHPIWSSCPQQVALDLEPKRRRYNSSLLPYLSEPTRFHSPFPVIFSRHAA